MEGRAVTLRAENSVIPNMNFRLTLDGIQIPCKSIQSFQQEKEQEYIQEGGLNGYVHIRPKPASKPSTLQIERYMTEQFRDDLPNGKILKGYLMLEVGERFQFIFKGCTVTGKSYGTLDAERNGILVETTTISYEQMEARAT